jgi:hypothetical protein
MPRLPIITGLRRRVNGSARRFQLNQLQYKAFSAKLDTI